VTAAEAAPTTERTRPAADDRPAVRLEIDSSDVARGFGQVVLAVADILRELLERQAIRRIDAGDLDEDQVERLGSSLMRIREEIAELRTALSSTGTQRPRRDIP
jgi:hypothetical protein